MRFLLAGVILVSALTFPAAHAQVTINDPASVVAIVDHHHAALKSGDSRS